MMRRFLPLGLFILLGLGACANQARLQEEAGTHIRMSSAYLAANQYNGALKELLAAEKLTPDDPRLHYLLGVTYLGKGLDDKAIAAFQRTIALSPDDSEAHNFLGAIYLDKGRLDEAIASFKKALANILYDSPATTLFNMGRAYYEKGQYDMARSNYREAAVKEPDSVLLPLIEKGLGMVFLAKGDLDEALGHFKKSVTMSPSLVESHYWLGLSYARLGRSDDAVRSFQTAVKLGPDSEFGRKAKEQLKGLSSN